MKRVTGIGGIFFKAKEARLRTWNVPGRIGLRSYPRKSRGGIR